MQFALAQHSTSKPIVVGAGVNITVTPSTGATALVEYTSDTAANIANGTATWAPWSNGAVSALAKDKTSTAVTARVTANNGAVYVDINDVPAANPSVAQIIYDASSKASLVDGSGNTIKLGSSVATAMGSGARFVSAASSFTTGAGTAVGKILDSQHPAPAAFVGAQLVYANFDTTAPMTINAAKVAASGVHLNAGTGLAWSDFVTFNGSQTATVPQASAGVGGSAMPNIIPGFLISDFIAVDSIPRTDGGAGYLLRARTHINDNSFPSWATFTTQNADGNGLLYASKSANGAVGTLTSAALAMQASTDHFEPVGIIFVYKGDIKTLAVFGDSLSMGAGTVSGIGWPGRVTVDYWQGGGTIISAMNFAESGQQLEDSHSRLRAYCALHKPTYCAFYAFSPNSVGRTAANFLTRWTMVLQTIAFLEARGIKPILMTSTPVETYSQTEKDQVTLQNSRVKALSDRITVIDGASVVSDGSLYYPQYKFDVTHYNDAGHKAIGALVYNTLK